MSKSNSELDKLKSLTNLIVGYDDIWKPHCLMKTRQAIAKEQYGSFYFSLPPIPMKHPIELDSTNGVPPMNAFYYGPYKKKKEFPSWTCFMEMYKEAYLIVSPNDSHMYTFRHENPRYHYDFTEDLISKKLIRTYMSFLKESHALVWFLDAGLRQAYWSYKNDLKLGIDIMIDSYGIKVYSRTPKAMGFAEEKKNRHPTGKNIRGIAIPIYNEGETIGDTYVARDDVLNCALKLITLGIEPITVCGPIGHEYIESGITL